MKIKDINTTNNFKSRNSTIRKADDIVRKINKEYIGVSPSNIEDFQNFKKFPKLDTRLDYKIKNLRSKSKTSMLKSKTQQEASKIIPQFIKKFKVRNCGESAELAYLGAKINGLKDLQICSLSSNKIGDLDHDAVLVMDDNKTYVLDAWLGFADYLPNAIKRYQKEFSYHFDLSGSPNEKLFFSASATRYSKVIDSLPKEFLCKEFPNLILYNPTNKKNPSPLKNFIEKIKELLSSDKS